MSTTLATDALCPVFGVRHLSPSGAWHLRRFLDQVRPKVVLIEGLSDADDLIPDMVRRQTIPPIAILAYTQDLPVRTLVYPIARYSPEYQALAWASENKADVHFIDLPSDIFLALEDVRQREAPPLPDVKSDEDGEGDEADRPVNTERRVSLYDRFAEQAGETDYETYWERRFEHNRSAESYRKAAFEFGRALRDLEQDEPRWRAENLVREAYMRRRIQETIDGGVPPEKIVAVVGAFHAPVLTPEHPPMTDELKLARPAGRASSRSCRIRTSSSRRSRATAPGTTPRRISVALGALERAIWRSCRRATCRWSPGTCASAARTARRPR
jgi:hypothetical protein